MLVTLLRTILIYVVVVCGLRLMGKRQLGELQPSELVVTILVSDIATLPIQDPGFSLAGGAVPILTLVCFEVLLSAATLKSRRLRRLVSGTPRRRHRPAGDEEPALLGGRPDVAAAGRRVF